MKTALITIGIIIILLFLLAVIQKVFNLAAAAGTLYGICFLLCGIFWNKLSFTAQRYISFLLFGSLFLAVWLCCKIKKAGMSTAKNQKPAIVLGCKVKGDVPSLALQKRVDAAFFYLLNNPDCPAILSGGQGRDENISEAQCMKKMLLERGISEDRLFIEEQSVSTDENIRFSKKIIAEHGLSPSGEAVIVSSEYHQLRAKIICKKYGLTSYSISSRTPFILLPTFLLREALALIKQTVMKHP